MTYEDYLSCSEYSGQAAHPSEANFSAFFHEASQRYFFALLDSTGDVLLKSEGYPQLTARENGIQSVLKNRTNRDFYSVKNEDGKYYISLRAANYREIARSCSCGSEAEALALVDYATGEKVRAAAIAADTTSAERADNKVDDDYMICREYAGHPGVGEDGLVKFTHTNGKHYFAWYDDDGDVLMRSEGYPTTTARDNGYESVLKNRELDARYATLERMGRYFTILKAGNHQEIARSCPYSSEADALAIYPGARASRRRAGIVGGDGDSAATSTIVESLAAAAAADAVIESAGSDAAGGGAGSETAAAGGHVEAAAMSATAAASGGGEADGDVEDDYMPCGEYEGRNINDKQNNVAMFKHENGQFYFAVYNADGSIRLRSEGFRTSQERDKELSGALRNLNNPDMYTTIKRGAYYITILKDKTGREVGRSCLQKDAPVIAEVVAAAAPVEVETVVEAPVVAAALAATAAPAVVETEAVAEVEDDYLPCREYEGHHVNDKRNNVALFKHENGQFYFAIYNADGGVRLRSEGFGSAKDRDSELSGALKNLTNPDMYEVKRRGIYYITVLKDKTGREVGRSCLQKDAPVIAEVVAAAAPVEVETVVETPAVAVAAFAATAAAATIETPAVEAVVETPAVEVAPPAVEADVEDDYLTCHEYEGHTVTDKANNVALFTHANGQYYFAVYNADGSVRLRSEGFRTTADRDGELASVLKNLNNGDKYETLRRGIYYMSILKDDAGHEVGRSCLHKEAPVAVAPKAAVAAAAVAATAAAVVVEAPKVETPKVEAPVVVDTDVEDDYLPCKDYEGRTINDKQNNVAMFKHENGQYYFAIYNADGSVRVRSEGFRSSQERDKELSGALKNLYNADMYTTIRKGKYYIQILKDKTGREVGRSCLMTEEPKPIVAPSVAAPIAAAATAAVASKLVETEKVEVKKEVVTPKVEVKKEVIAPKVEAKRVVEAAAPVVTEAVEEAATGGFKWWWMLLPLLLGALWFLKDGCNKTEVAPATTSVDAPKATLPAVDTVKAEAPAPVVAPKATGCSICAGGASDDAIFTSVCDNPKKLSRLGTNPEFGNSHALSPEGFYNKIKKAYADNEVDKVFLDKIYKSMGYEGFKDAKAEQFTAVVLPQGTSGRLGYSKAHKTGCYTLPDDEYHRKAFHIKSANGCDLHFMKTCGNHFFFCKN
jgi:uncharacterized protein YegP (UPF0339 family)